MLELKLIHVSTRVHRSQKIVYIVLRYFKWSAVAWQWWDDGVPDNPGHFGWIIKIIIRADNVIIGKYKTMSKLHGIFSGQSRSINAIAVTHVMLLVNGDCVNIYTSHKNDHGMFTCRYLTYVWMVRGFIWKKGMLFCISVFYFKCSNVYINVIWSWQTDAVHTREVLTLYNMCWRKPLSTLLSSTWLTLGTSIESKADSPKLLIRTFIQCLLHNL